MDERRTHDPMHDVVDRAAASEHEFTGRRRRAPTHRPVRRIALGLVTVLLVYYVFSLVQVVQTGRNHSADRAEAILVLGAAQYDGRPSPQLAARLDHVLTMWTDGVAPVVMVTGGKLPDDRFTEAEASRGYLVDRGIPEDSIMMENVGRTTYESLQSASTLLLDAGLDDVIVVSDSYHLKRAELIANGFGLHAEGSATPTSVVSGGEAIKRNLAEAGGVAVGRIIGFRRLTDLAG
ncbi:MAG: YdcF family protein [Ilumatobacteraceae bacterium]